MQENQKKDSNPKDALGVKKVPLHAVPVKPLFEVGLAMMEGGRKYGTHNYRAIGVRMSTYYNAAMRHLMAWWEGEDVDADSGVPHLVKAMASLFVVRDGILMGNCVDDRPVRYPDGIDMEVLNAVAADLIEKYPECAKAFLHIAEPNKLTAETLKKSEAREDLHTIPLDKLIEELESDEPQFKAGDKVRIVLHNNRQYSPGLIAVCEAARGFGIYSHISYDGEKHVIQLRGAAGQHTTEHFYTDELILVEDN